MPDASPPLHLVVVGGGHASLPLLADAGALAKRGVHVTLVSDAPVLWYSGMTPEWLGGVYTRSDATVDLVAICRREGVRFVVDRAVGVDRVARTVQTASGEAHSYDVLVLDVGAVNPHADAAAGAVHTKPLHAIERLGDALDAGLARLVIVGGGAAGVETAFNVTARRQAPHVTLLEPSDHLLAGMPMRAGRWAADTLRARGADVRLGSRVLRSDAHSATLADGTRVEADAVLWATGSAGAPWLAASGFPTTAAGFVRVRPTLQLHGDDDTFAAGDMAVVAGYERLPRIGVHAVKQGPTLAANVARCLDALAERPARALTTFRPYPVAPLILSTGTPEAWVAAGPIALRGHFFLGLKHAVDRRWIARYAVRPLSRDGRWDLAHAGGA